MPEHEFLRCVLAGAIAGGACGVLARQGLIGDVISGVLGALTASYIATQVHPDMGSGFLSPWLAATAGALILILTGRLIRRAP